MKYTIYECDFCHVEDRFNMLQFSGSEDAKRERLWQDTYFGLTCPDCTKKIEAMKEEKNE